METKRTFTTAIITKPFFSWCRNFHDVRTLSTKEFTAAKLEAKQEIGKIAKASVSLGIWSACPVDRRRFLSLAIVFLLAQIHDTASVGSLGAVGLTYSIIGGIIILIGKSRAAGAKPIPENFAQHERGRPVYSREGDWSLKER